MVCRKIPEDLPDLIKGYEQFGLADGRSALGRRIKRLHLALADLLPPHGVIQAQFFEPWKFFFRISS